MAYYKYRIRSDYTIKRLIKKNDKKLIVFKPINDLQYADRFLELYPSTQIIWIYRNYHDVIKSAVKKWGTAHKDIMMGISNEYNKRSESVTIKERMEPGTLQVVKKLCNTNMTSEDGAALL